MAKRAVCVGINDYPGGDNDLNGCINDAHAWASLLEDVFGFHPPQVVVDDQATRERMLDALDGLVSDAGPGDVVVFTYSGHGTWEYDQGDADESDNRDEALCAFDGNIVDDELREIVRRIDPKAFLTVISDSCHSGSVTRAALARERANEDSVVTATAPRPRYMPPKRSEDAIRAPMIPIRRRAWYPESGMPELLLTGCNATEYSYDAYINGRYNGAMTAMATSLIRNDPGMTYRELHRRLRTMLPSTRYPQSPQCEGSDANKDRKLFT